MNADFWLALLGGYFMGILTMMGYNLVTTLMWQRHQRRLVKESQESSDDNWWKHGKPPPEYGES